MKEEASAAKEEEAEASAGPKGPAEGEEGGGVVPKGAGEVGSDLEGSTEVGSDLQEGVRRLANLSLPARDKPERSVRLMKERQMLQKYD